MTFCAGRGFIVIVHLGQRGFYFPCFLGTRGRAKPDSECPKNRGEKPTMLPEVRILLIASKGKHEFPSIGHEIVPKATQISAITAQILPILKFSMIGDISVAAINARLILKSFSSSN